MMSSLPACAAFKSKSNGKFLRYCMQDGEEANNQLLQLSGDGFDAMNPCNRFHLDPSSKHDGLVHIRCCYNNKYWVAKQLRDDEWWISGSADEPEEDLSQMSCTLFELKPVAKDPNSISFRKIMEETSGRTPIRVLNSFLVTYNPHHEDKVNDYEEQSGQFRLTIVNPVLPRIMCFKGDNGLYLSPRLINNNQQLLYVSKDITDPTVRHMTAPTWMNCVLIKSDHAGLFWRSSPLINNKYSMILADSMDTRNDDTVFQPLTHPQVRGQVMLFSYVSQMYCRRDREGTDALLAIDTIHEATRISYEEPVLSREISNVQFRANHARFYNHSDLTLATASATNNTSELQSMVRLVLRFTVTQGRSWSVTTTHRSEVRTSITSTGLFTMDGRSVMEKGEFRGITWVKNIFETSQKSVDYYIDVKPRTMVTVTCRARECRYDVPYSYQQTDKMVDGEVLTYDFLDGLYTGRNVYSIEYHVTETPVPE